MVNYEQKMYKLVRNTHDYLEDIPPNEDNIYFEYEDIKKCADNLLVSLEDIMNDFVKTSWRKGNSPRAFQRILSGCLRNKIVDIDSVYQTCFIISSYPFAGWQRIHHGHGS